MRKIKSVVVYYDDNSAQQWHGNGMVVVGDTVDPGPPPTSVSFVTVTLSIAPRMKLHPAGYFTERVTT